MLKRYILTAFGKDRPGIVADVTEILYQNGCNLEDTTMSMLSDEFTINLLFSSSKPDTVDVLREECQALEKEKSISAFIRPLQESQPAASGKLPLCTIHVEGLDQAGIVYKISRYLSDNGLNIVDLKSMVKTTPGWVLPAHRYMPWPRDCMPVTARGGGAPSGRASETRNTPAGDGPPSTPSRSMAVTRQ